MANNKLFAWGLLILLCICAYNTEAKKIHDKQYKFKLTIPAQMTEVTGGKDTTEGKIFYDPSAGVVMIISERKSKFKSVNEYIDCGTEGLEKQLSADFNDPGLKLIDCRKPGFYPSQTTILHFKVSTLPNGDDTYMIYFIHHGKKDIQFSFTYKYASERKSQDYINTIMQTLKLQ